MVHPARLPSPRLLDAAPRMTTSDGAIDLPARPGPRPRTTAWNPHVQLDQNAPPVLVEALLQRMLRLDGVEARPSLLGAPGTRALCLAGGACPRAGFLAEGEFAHLRPGTDGSLHLALSTEHARHAIGAGWAEQHPFARLGFLPAGVVMVFGPRDDGESDVVWRLLQASLARARAAAMEAALSG